MKAQRIILAHESRFMRDILRRTLQKSGLHIVGETADLAVVPALIEKTNAHWVIVSLLPDGHVTSAAEVLLAAYPSICILAVAADGSQIKTKQVRFHEKILKIATLEELIAALGNTGP